MCGISDMRPQRGRDPQVENCSDSKARLGMSNGRWLWATVDLKQLLLHGAMLLLLGMNLYASTDYKLALVFEIRCCCFFLFFTIKKLKLEFFP